MATRLFQTDTTDEIILATAIVAILSTFFLLIILIWIYRNFRKDKSLFSRLSLSCIVSVACFMLFACFGSIGWTDIIFPISSTSCKVFYSLGLITYNIAKISMYWLFTLRIEVIFEQSSLAFNSKILWIYRIFAAIIPSILWIIWIYLSWHDLKPHALNKYSYCFPITFNDKQFASHIAGGLAWSDLIFSAIAVCIFVLKLYQITQLANNNMMDKNHNHINGDNNSKSSISRKSISKFRQSLLKPNRISSKWIYTIRKSTILCLVAILSTWTYVLGTGYIFRQCGFFISFDGVINSLCLACLFKFGDECYKLTCSNFDKCCIALWCCTPFTPIMSNKKKKKKKKRKNRRNGIKKVISIDHSSKIASMGGAKALELEFYSSSDDDSDVILKYTTNVDDESSKSKSRSYRTNKTNQDDDDNIGGYKSPQSIIKEKQNNDNVTNVPLKIDTNTLHNNIANNDNNGNVIALKTPNKDDGKDSNDMPSYRRAKSEGMALYNVAKKVRHWQHRKGSKKKSPSPIDSSLLQSAMSPIKHSPNKKLRTKSLSLMSESEKSCTFMLLDMSASDDDDVYDRDNSYVLREDDELYDSIDDAPDEADESDDDDDDDDDDNAPDEEEEEESHEDSDDDDNAPDEDE